MMMNRWMMMMPIALLPLAGCGTEDTQAQAADSAPQALVSETGAAAEGGAAVCTVAEASRPLPDAIHESSGVAASRAHRGIFWTHNDSGDPEVFAVDAAGRMAGRVRVSGASVVDWEDVSLAACPGGDCLYVADIGDNEAERASITVWRFPEPAPGDAQSRPAEEIRLRYPDGSHDAEAMFVLDGRVHVLTKGETGPIALYRAPAGARAGEAVTMEKVRELAAGEVERAQRITSADASPDGRWIVTRTLEEAVFYPAADFVSGGSAAPRRMNLAALDEAQGEGIGFTADGAVLLTSEGGKKKDPATFARLSCTL
jgi:hypothetical protein